MLSYKLTCRFGSGKNTANQICGIIEMKLLHNLDSSNLYCLIFPEIRKSMPFCWHSGYNIVPTRAYTTVGTFITLLLILVYPTDVEVPGVIKLPDTGGAER